MEPPKNPTALAADAFFRDRRRASALTEAQEDHRIWNYCIYVRYIETMFFMNTLIKTCQNLHGWVSWSLSPDSRPSCSMSIIPSVLLPASKSS